MIRLSKETDYGIVLLTHLADNVGRASYSARALAQETHLPLPMVSKILKVLARQDLLHSQRGVKGGYRLARRPEEISVADIIGAMEGPIALTECVSAPGDCRHEPLCPVRVNWQTISRAVRQALEGIALSDMTRRFEPDWPHLENPPIQIVSLQ
jgi:FeS assembly SUF system regulator